MGVVMSLVLLYRQWIWRWMSRASLVRPCPALRMCTVSRLTPMSRTLAVSCSWGPMSVGGMARYAHTGVGVASHVTLQGVVIGVGEQSEFGTVFKMMRNEEVCISTCMCVHVHACVCMCVHVRACAYMCVHVRACVYMCVHVYTCVYMCIDL